MPRLDEYDGLLTSAEAVQYLAELMGSFAPTAETFRQHAKPRYRLAHPESAAARFLKPAVRNVAGDQRNGWTREQLRAYAQARASRSGAAQQREEP